MIIQKLRLEHGWSQEQLADMSGLSKRTIQRIENGNTPSIESVKSLAAVFEVEFSTLNSALRTDTMDYSTLPNNDSLNVSDKEKLAFLHIKKVKNFYKQLLIFTCVISFLIVINYITSPNYWWVIWVFLGWGISLSIRAFFLFLQPKWLGPEWEKRQIKQFLDKMDK